MLISLESFQSLWWKCKFQHNIARLLELVFWNYKKKYTFRLKLNRHKLPLKMVWFLFINDFCYNKLKIYRVTSQQIEYCWKSVYVKPLINIFEMQVVEFMDFQLNMTKRTLNIKSGHDSILWNTKKYVKNIRYQNNKIPLPNSKFRYLRETRS